MSTSTASMRADFDEIWCQQAGSARDAWIDRSLGTGGRPPLSDDQRRASAQWIWNEFAISISKQTRIESCGATTSPRSCR